jgi:hypothetical protein
LSKAQPYRNKTGFALCFVLSGAMPSHRTIPDLFQPPGSRNSPTAPALACSCNGVSLASPPTCRMMLRLLAENKKAGYYCPRWKPLNRGKSMSNRPSMSLSTATQPILKQRGGLSSPYDVMGCWWLASNPAHSPAGSVLPTDASAHLVVNFLNYTNTAGD